MVTCIDVIIVQYAPRTITVVYMIVYNIYLYHTTYILLSLQITSHASQSVYWFRELPHAVAKLADAPDKLKRDVKSYLVHTYTCILVYIEYTIVMYNGGCVVYIVLRRSHYKVTCSCAR